MNFLTTFLVVLGFSAQIWAEEARLTRIRPNKPDRSAVKLRATQGDAEILNRLLEGRRKQNDLLYARSSVPVIWEGNQRIQTGKVLRGVLLNSIVSTNLASPVLVRVSQGQSISSLTKFSCQAVTLNKRVHTECSRMISPQNEINISAQLLNLDGSAGLIGHIDDAKEELMGAAIASSFAQGALSLAQSRVTTPLGQIQDSTLKNQLYQGAIQSGGAISDMLIEEMSTVTPTITIQAGTEVLIYFKEAIDDQK